MTVTAFFPAFIRLVLLFALSAMAALPAYGQSRAVQQKRELINWYYAATFGTGVYTTGERDVAVIQIPVSRDLRAVVEDSYGLKLKVPVTFGFYDYKFDNVLTGDLPEQVSTLSVMPGLEWEMPLTRRWTLKPYFSVGAGQELSGKESALIYDFGLKSRYLLGYDKGVEFALVNMLTSAGNRPRGGSTETFGVLAIGVDMVIPTNGVLFGRNVSIGFTPILTYYFDKLRFALSDDADNRLRKETAIAVSVMSRNPWSLKYFDVDRVGLAIRHSGDITGVSFFTSLPF